MLDVRDISKKYGDNTAVHNITFSIKPGEIAGIIGPNGAGKSTFLKMVCGLLRPDSGIILVGGKDISQDDIAKKKIGYVPEDSPVYDDMTVREYLQFFGDLYELSRIEIDNKMKTLFQSLDFTALDRELGNLSKGMKRKVMIARSLLHDPPLLIYDEPASGLDPSTTHTIIEYVKDLRSQKKTVLISGHNLFQMEQLCDRIIILKEGKVLVNDTIESLKKKGIKPIVEVFTSKSGKQHRTVIDQKELDTALRSLLKDGHKILAVKTPDGNLEDAFLSLTQ